MKCWLLQQHAKRSLKHLPIGLWSMWKTVGCTACPRLQGRGLGPLVAKVFEAFRSRAQALCRPFEELPRPLHDATATHLQGASVGIHLQFRNDMRLGLLMDRHALEVPRNALDAAETLLTVGRVGPNH